MPNLSANRRTFAAVTRYTSMAIAFAVAVIPALFVPQQAAYAAPANVHMPFPCGETWYASTSSGHSPSEHSVDWNIIGNDEGRSVRAGVTGTATVMPYHSGYGNWVEVNAGSGWTYRYAHLSQITVSNGPVTSQTEIGKVGDSGNSDGPHLHYEQRLNGMVQPATFNGQPISYAYSFPGNAYTSTNCGSSTVDDVLQASGVSGVGWRVSYGGTSGWQQMNLSTTTKASLLLGDFDEDGYTDDVMQATGISGIGWRVRYNGTSSWQPLKNSTTTKNTLMVGDFDGDGYNDDVFQASGVHGIGWRVSINGTSGWQDLRLYTTTTKDTLLLGDFD